jgi:hypothetical protein
MRCVLPMRALICIVLFAAELANPLLVLAQATPTAANALVAVDDADPLQLARIARRYGDTAILALLDAAQPAATRLAAIRATPWLARPEDALTNLAREVASRDAELAESAARALFAIAQGLDAATLASREQSASALGPVVASLDALAGQTWIRADLRALVASAVAQLEAFGAPAPSHD